MSHEEQLRMEEHYRSQLREKDEELKELKKKEKEFMKLEKLKRKTDDACSKLKTDVERIKAQKAVSIILHAVRCLLLCTGEATEAD